MTDEQTKLFFDSITRIIGASVLDNNQINHAVVRSALRFLWLARNSNGYLNLSHEEAMLICDTDKNGTMRRHLIQMEQAGVLQGYSTNGTVRMKFAGYAGREMILHKEPVSEIPNPALEITNSVLEIPVSINDCKSSDPHARLRALRYLLRAHQSHPYRNFDDYPQNPSSMLVSQLDPLIPPEMETNKLTATVTDPVEEALSVALMTAAGVWMKTAKQLAKQHPFEVIRRAIAFWWCNRRSRGGEFAETPGIVLTWLNNLEQTTIPPLSTEFKASDLYLNHLTSAERAELEQSAETIDETPVDDDINPMDSIDRMLYWQEQARRRQS